jgi:hypothetical protein
MNRKSRYEQNDAVYFHCLHTSVAPRLKGELNADGTTYVEVEGKPRRMLILSADFFRIDVSTAQPTGKKNRYSEKNVCDLYEAKAKIGYLVLPLQSKVPDGRENEFMPLPRGCLDEGRPTVVHLHPQSYPPESICHSPDKPVKQITSWVVDEILKQISLGSHRWHMA